MIKTNGSSGRLPAAANSFMIITLAVPVVVVNALKLDSNGLNSRRHSKLVNVPCTMTSLASEGTKMLAKTRLKDSSRSIKIKISDSKRSTERLLTKMEMGKSTHFISKALAKTPVNGNDKPKKISLKSKLGNKQAKNQNTVSFNETCMICFTGSRGREISNVRTSTGITVISNNNIKVEVEQDKAIQTRLNHGIKSRTFMILCTHTI